MRDPVGKGDMAIFELLKEEHDRFRETLARIESQQKKGDTFDPLKRQMDTHMEGEEEYVYPALRAAGMKEEVLESLEEHHVVKILLAELQEMPDREEAWMPNLKVLMEEVEHHIDKEERQIFPKAAHKIDSAKQEELADQYRQFESVAASAGASLPESEWPFYRNV